MGLKCSKKFMHIQGALQALRVLVPDYENETIPISSGCNLKQPVKSSGETACLHTVAHTNQSLQTSVMRLCRYTSSQPKCCSFAPSRLGWWPLKSWLCNALLTMSCSLSYEQPLVYRPDALLSDKKYMSSRKDHRDTSKHVFGQD